MQGSDDSGSAPEVEISKPKTVATGIPAVVSSITRTVRRMGPLDPVRTLLRLNQPDGFDCPGCAWPEPPPGDRSRAEYAVDLFKKMKLGHGKGRDEGSIDEVLSCICANIDERLL